MSRTVSSYKASYNDDDKTSQFRITFGQDFVAVRELGFFAGSQSLPDLYERVQAGVFPFHLQDLQLLEKYRGNFPASQSKAGADTVSVRARANDNDSIEANVRPSIENEESFRECEVTDGIVNAIGSTREMKTNSKLDGTMKIDKPDARKESIAVFKDPHLHSLKRKKKIPSTKLQNAPKKLTEDYKDPIIMAEEANEEICSMCDDGGSLLICDSFCHRPFHTTVHSDYRKICRTLQLEAEPVDSADFFCLNCRAGMHQCFICFELGCSRKGPQQIVFRCEDGPCYRFYHASCVGSFLADNFGWDESATVRDILSAGCIKSCPLHLCINCKLPGSCLREAQDFLVPCRSCPKAFHKACLPQKEWLRERSATEPQRIWGMDEGDDFQPMVYCGDHEVARVSNLLVRQRHRWPGEAQGRDYVSSTGELEERMRREEDRRVQRALEAGKLSVDARQNRDKVLGQAKRASQAEQNGEARASLQASSRSALVVREAGKVQRPAGGVNRDWTMQFLADSKGAAAAGATEEGQQMEAGHRPILEMLRILEKRQRTRLPVGAVKDIDRKVLAIRMRVREKCDWRQVVLSRVKFPHLFKDSEVHPLARRPKYFRKAMAEVTRAAQYVRSYNLSTEEMLQKVLETTSCTRQNLLELANSIRAWKLYWNPFLHGSKYTSYGRHFTKVDILKEVVERLEPYICDGDCVADMCCGSNDFILLLKDLLRLRGKTRCTFRSFDICQAKDRSDFETRDWFSVQHEGASRELPPGNNLVLGLNPPFGVNGILAQKFAWHAAKFDPKLIVLIAPPNTGSPSRSYKLLWQDAGITEGEVFYIPGSLLPGREIPVENRVPPPLQFWARNDKLEEFKRVAMEKGQIEFWGQELYGSRRHSRYTDG